MGLGEIGCGLLTGFNWLRNLKASDRNESVLEKYETHISIMRNVPLVDSRQLNRL
jgi:hypothetical protein